VRRIWLADGTPIIAKIGINRNQLYWTEQIAAADPALVPTFYASGTWPDLDVHWMVMERVPYECLGPAWNGAEFDMLLHAAVRFQRAARMVERRHIQTLDLATLREWLDAGIAHMPPGPYEHVIARLPDDWQWVQGVCETEVCHGDVHMCNAVTRDAPPEPGAALLIDCQPSLRPWAFDAAYPQVLNSIDRARPGYRDLVPRMGKLRERQEMSSCADLERLERITLAWFAIRMWAYTPERHLIADYVAETARYIAESAALSE
jgi:hypothetical protein